MQITPANLQAIFYTFDTIYQKGFQNAPVWSKEVASEIPSGGRSLRHAYINKIPRMRQWVGERQMNNLVANGYEIVNNDYELSLQIDRNDIEDDLIGVYAPGTEMIGQQAAKWPDDLVLALLQNGATSLGPDGVSFFNTAHPTFDAAGDTYSNYSSSSFALTSANFNTARSRMMAFKGADGKAMGITPNLLVVPPALEVAARQILNTTWFTPANSVGQVGTSGPSENVLYGMAKLLVVPELAGVFSGDTAWFLLDTSKPIKPFVFQLRKAPQFVMRTDPSLDNVWRWKTFEMGVDSRGAGGYALPHLAYAGVG